MSKISKDDIKILFADLVDATKPSDKDAGKQKFIDIVTENKDKFNQPMDVPFANGNTINHSIARAVSKCEKTGCGLCISKDASSFGTNYGEAPYKVLNYINDNDDVKEEYKKLFSESYKNVENNHANKYTPLDFAKTCNPEFAEYMEPKQQSLRNSLRRSIESIKTSVKKSIKSVSKKTASAKDEDITIEQLQEKIAGLEKKIPILHYVFENSADEKKYKNSDSYKQQKTKDKELDAEINRLKKILKKKTAKSFLSRVLTRKGGKTIKHNKSTKRRSYRRK
jgi:hypothetical protein